MHGSTKLKFSCCLLAWLIRIFICFKGNQPACGYQNVGLLVFISNTDGIFWICLNTVPNITGKQYFPGSRLRNFLFQVKYFRNLGAGSKGIARCLLHKRHFTRGSIFQSNILLAINLLYWTTWSDWYAFLYVRNKKCLKIILFEFMSNYFKIHFRCRAHILCTWELLLIIWEEDCFFR